MQGYASPLNLSLLEEGPGSATQGGEDFPHLLGWRDIVVYTWVLPLAGCDLESLNISEHQCFHLKNGTNHLSHGVKAKPQNIGPIRSPCMSPCLAPLTGP